MSNATGTQNNSQNAEGTERADDMMKTRYSRQFPTLGTVSHELSATLLLMQIYVL